MASFYAELRVAGYTYPVPHCTYEFSQATNGRGQVAEKVRHGLVQLVLDVPEDDFLLAWGAAPYKPLAGCIVFFNAQGGPALETLSWEVGHCVGYQEVFESGQLGDGSYECHVTIAAEKLTMQPGGAGAYVPPAPGEHGTPPLAAAPLLAVEEAVVATTPELVAAPTLLEMLGSLGAFLGETLAAGTAAVAAPALLTLGLIAGSSTPAGGPGDPHLVPPPNPDELRLRYLVAQHDAGTLAAGDEAELIALLAKVKGIHVQKLSDLTSKGLLRGSTVQLPGFYNIPLQYTKRTDADRKALRAKFDSSIKKNFLKKIGSDPNARDRLKASGLTDDEIDDMADGIQPDKYQVHHKLSLDDGGDNSFDNLVLIKHEPYHKSITNLQISLTKGMKAGDTRLVQWPTYPGFVYP